MWEVEIYIHLTRDEELILKRLLLVVKDYLKGIENLLEFIYVGGKRLDEENI